ncbi:uncharacterized protein LOC120273212 [Dioscorea cayenensis subsp. rotundata]|uniref:Uncharacterized protein LOC120273212 n=1 Tax=Dioscorea cayennensis subsp. rotundata TaxID=55577 RepID=A0AB40C9I5_DIOCR|nr:uncharacterized protein LOC120273212 [Dioscorea cayenensis subsp. rotundata]
MGSSSDVSTVAQKKRRAEFDPSDIIADPGLQKPIEEYDTGIRDQVRREYLLMGPCQPVGHTFPRKQQGKGLAFRGHDKSSSSTNKGNFLEMLNWYRTKVENVGHVINENAPGNNQMTSPQIQKELVRACAEETTRAIINEIGDSYFSILLDKSRDKSVKEQMAVIVRFVNKQGQVIERFLAVEHVADTSTPSLKIALDGLFDQKDQNIVNAMGLIVTVKELMQDLRENKWGTVLEEVRSFCVEMSVSVPNMEDSILIRGRSRCGGQLVTYYHHYHAEIFIAVIDLLTTEMNNRFSETSTKLLRCIACLDLRNSFSKFDHGMLVRLAQLYSDDFSTSDHLILKEQLRIYIHNVRRNSDFSSCHDLASLAVKMVQFDKHLTYPLVYRLIELALILPVATAIVERAFSAMNIIKKDLRNKISDEWLNNMMDSAPPRNHE